MTFDSREGNLKRLTPYPRAFTESTNLPSGMANEPLAGRVKDQKKIKTYQKKIYP